MDRFAPTTAAAGGADVQTQALVLAPAVLRMVISGKDVATELDALTRAVAILQRPDAAMRELVYGMATELALTVEAEGMVALADQVKAALAPEALAEAVRLGLGAIFLSPLGDDGDIGILSGIAERLGLSEDDFSDLYENARAAVAQG